jgi:hypothetical protein
MIAGEMARIRWLFFLAAFVIIGPGQPELCRAAAPGEMLSPDSPAANPEKTFGITIVSLRPTAGGHMLDLRFRVVDPEKARVILDKNKKAYLLDDRTGKTLPVPVTKAGSMRQTTLKPQEGRIYFALFSNPNRMVTEGGSVSLLIGNFRKDGIMVESSGAAPASTGKPTLQHTGESVKP